MKIVLMGPPGSGKGTMATMIHEQLNIPHISTGKLFRIEVKQESELGNEVRAYLAQGELVPDETTLQMLNKRLNQDDTQNGFILDGFPRTQNQAQLLENEGVIVDKVFYLKIADSTVIERITKRRTCNKCGMMFHLTNIPPKKEGICDVCGGELIHREDEKEETIKHRIEVYHKDTEPLLQFYQQRNVLIEIDAELTPHEIFEKISGHISGK